MIRTLKIFGTGAFCYSLAEMLYRGKTHWTMAVLSGILFCILYRYYSDMPNEPLWKMCLMGTLIITSFEFTAGVILNIILGMKVWDYSRMPFNILGQICLPFCGVWFMLCIPAYLICFWLKKRLR